MSLYTGKRVHSYIWEELTIDDGVIQRLEQLAEIEKQPVLVDVNNFLNGTRCGNRRRKCIRYRG